MEVPEYLVSAPAANQLDDVSVDTHTEEGHGTSVAEGAGKGFLGFKH